MAKPAARPVRADQNRTERKDAGKRELVVGEGIRLKADIEHCDTLTVRGWLESSLRSERVEVLRGGMLKGNIDTDDAVIDGQLEGTLTVRSRLVLKGNGKLSGTIRYNRLEIQDGGSIAGDVGPLGQAAGTPAATS